jgi:hypothetical protein
VGQKTSGECDVKSSWLLVESFARILPVEEREPVLGDMIEAGENAWQALCGLVGFAVRRHVENWRSWRPWLAGFGIALPNSFLLMGASISVSWSYMRLLCPDMLAQASLNKPSAMLVLLWQSLLLIGWAWTSGFVVGSLSKRTLWASTLLCYAPCLLCVSKFDVASLPKFCLLLFLLPAIWGAHRGFRISRLNFSSALFIAFALTLMIVPTLSSSRLQTLSPQNILLNWALSIPAWYLVFVAWKRKHEPQVEHAA